MARVCLLSFWLCAMLACLLIWSSHGDVYMHNPRGSNDRLSSRGVNRQNANRLFDSQNNAKGGYNVGGLTHSFAPHLEVEHYNMKYFQSGSKHRSAKGKTGKSSLVISWTNQHGCGHPDLNCDIILQYKCQPNGYDLFSRNSKAYDTIRNGGTEGTIPFNKNNRGAYIRKTNKNWRKKREARMSHGMHEPWEWYDKCNRRERNKGLFTADQNLKKDYSTYTRQNARGTRYGYECPEERDYYPYWHPTDWTDIAVLTKDNERCKKVKEQSFNTKPKGECLEFYVVGVQKTGYKHYSKHNNPTSCKTGGGIWVEFTSFIEVKPEYKTQGDCAKASTQDVPLVWGVPYRSEEVDALEIDVTNGNQPKKSCLVQPTPVDCREAPLSRPNHLGNVKDAEPMNYTWILPYFPSQNEMRCVLRLRYNISTMDYNGDSTDSKSNGNNSPVKNDPEVKLSEEFGDIKLQLAVNTAQFGRTFQDRSHVLLLSPRQASGNNIPHDAAVYNLNVQGKRGNIVQVYPAVEYDFIPKNLIVNLDDIVHIQWTGSNTNPPGNDGEGTRGTDRSNIVETDDSGINVRFKKDGQMFKNAELVWAADRDTKTSDDLMVAIATSGFYSGHNRKSELGYNPRRRRRFQDQLNESRPSFSAAVRFKQPGKYSYMCTRNNNFSNRNQKASIRVVAGTAATVK